MTFNVENLFDTEDDPGKDDKAYLPATAKQTEQHRAECRAIEVPRWRDECLDLDWNEAILDRKLAAVANTILQVGNGRGPDIIALQEIENSNVLEQLRSEYLQGADYLPGILIEGRDDRGIDVAFLSRFPLAAPARLHDIVFSTDVDEREADTRGILQADFRLPDDSILTGFSVHFPAPYHPTAMRIDAYDRLNELAAALPPDRFSFAAGDFNTTTTEDLRENMLDRFARPYWTVAHDMGCGHCRGTSYYGRDDSWSFLDMILWSGGQDFRGADATWGVREKGVRVANETPQQVRPDGTPRRFSPADGSGVSDHWPLLLYLERK